jgi:hypothetical protein
MWIIWIILWNAIRCCFWFFDGKFIKSFSCIFGRDCLLSLLLFSSCCVVWQHHHFFNYFYVLHKWHSLIFRPPPPPLLRVLSTSKIILELGYHAWYLCVHVCMYISPSLNFSLCLSLYVILLVFWSFIAFFAGFLNNLLWWCYC